MPQVSVNGVEIHYEDVGDGPPVLMLSGLGGAARSWGPNIDAFGERFRVIAADHRGTGSSSRPDDGYTIEAHATDMAELLRFVGTGPAHIVGSSTGGAIAQMMALEHPDVVRSITLVSSWARDDEFFRQQFAVRKRVLLELGPQAYADTSALFLFSPEFFATDPGAVRAWRERSSSDPGAVEIMAKRIDMILAFDVWDRLPDVGAPTLVLVGAADGCTPPHYSRQIASRIPEARLEVIEGGHLIYKERPGEFRSVVMRFLDSVAG